ncbi:unnamed protein product [Caenorhabditis bovis]|uniref:Uncharacterized protein n=1 Tax=Caenorhabditis bovis TaxID=2654633 RepID=A0A8S1ENA6_9PELO|nr:unnamed protein product [Caenorhabditis bovis]
MSLAPLVPKTSVTLTVDDLIEPLRRRSIPKEESPRSGLKPQDTLGLDERRESSCSIIERRIEEQRKYSSYGIEAPIAIDIPEEGASSSRKASTSPIKSETSRHSSISWTYSFRMKFSNMRLSNSPASLSASRRSNNMPRSSESSPSLSSTTTVVAGPPQRQAKKFNYGFAVPRASHITCCSNKGPW